MSVYKNRHISHRQDHELPHRKKYRKYKATDELVTKELLEDRFNQAFDAGFDEKAKWIVFCEMLLEKNYVMYLYEAKETFSKYITVTRLDSEKRFKVRFSNHKPNKGRELNGDCDFFVGVTHTGIRTTEMAIKAVKEYFK